MNRIFSFVLMCALAGVALENQTFQGTWQFRDSQTYRADNGKLSFKRKWDATSYQFYWEFSQKNLTTYTHTSWAYPFVDQLDTVAYGCFMKLSNTLSISDSTIVVGVRDTLKVLFASDDSLVIRCPSFTKRSLTSYVHREFKRVSRIDSTNCRGK